MIELSEPVTQRTIDQIERISDALFRQAAAIPGICPDTELGTGASVEIEGDNSFVRLIKRHDSPKTFNASTQLLAGPTGDIELQDFRHSPASNKSRGIVLTRSNNYGGFTMVEPSSEEISENPGVNPWSGILENYTETRDITDYQVRRFAAEVLNTMVDYLHQAQLNSSER